MRERENGVGIMFHWVHLPPAVLPLKLLDFCKPLLNFWPLVGYACGCG
jgi:hypothetical protein